MGQPRSPREWHVTDRIPGYRAYLSLRERAVSYAIKASDFHTYHKEGKDLSCATHIFIFNIYYHANLNSLPALTIDLFCDSVWRASGEGSGAVQ